MEVLLFSIFNGVLYGMLLFMLASGLTLIFSLMGVLNFAHASFFMLGAYFAYQISVFIGFWPGLIFAPLIVGGIGAAIERYGLRPVHKFGQGIPDRVSGCEQVFNGQIVVDDLGDRVFDFQL